MPSDAAVTNTAMPVELGLDAVNHSCLPSPARINSYGLKRAALAIYGQMFNRRCCGEWQVVTAGAGWRGARGVGRGLGVRNNLLVGIFRAFM